MDMICKCGSKEFFTENTAIRPDFTALLVVSGRNGSRKTKCDFSITASRTAGSA